MALKKSLLISAWWIEDTARQKDLVILLYLALNKISSAQDPHATMLNKTSCAIENKI
jgi:hypothetical protein